MQTHTYSVSCCGVGDESVVVIVHFDAEGAPETPLPEASREQRAAVMIGSSAYCSSECGWVRKGTAGESG